jgi:pimeloyl-[acyl-carrier protein] methyl ester esterase
VTGLHVESAGHGAPLVVLHGFALHGGLFAPVVPALARTRRVHVVDLPGHGHSHATAGTLDDYVDAVATFVASLGAPAALLGWSFGGLVAMRLAHLRPQLTEALLLVCTTPKFVAGDTWPHAMAAATLARFGDELAAEYRITLKRFLALQVQGSEDAKSTLAALRQSLFDRASPRPGALASVLAILATTDLRDDVRDIRVPVLVISGRRDALTPAAAGAWLARSLPDARYVEIDGAAHAPFLSHATAFVAAVDDFLLHVDTPLSRA